MNQVEESVIAALLTPVSKTWINPSSRLGSNPVAAGEDSLDAQRGVVGPGFVVLNCFYLRHQAQVNPAYR